MFHCRPFISQCWPLYGSRAIQQGWHVKDTDGQRERERKAKMGVLKSDYPKTRLKCKGRERESGHMGMLMPDGGNFLTGRRQKFERKFEARCQICAEREREGINFIITMLSRNSGWGASKYDVCIGEDHRNVDVEREVA